MTPHFRAFLGASALIAILTFAMARGARADEVPPPSPEALVCMVALTSEAIPVWDRHAAGVPSAVNRWLIRSDRDIGGQGRWVLLRFLDAVEAGQWFDREAALTQVLGALCALHDIPEAPPAFLREFDKPRAA